MAQELGLWRGVLSVFIHLLSFACFQFIVFYKDSWVCRVALNEQYEPKIIMAIFNLYAAGRIAHFHQTCTNACAVRRERFIIIRTIAKKEKNIYAEYHTVM